MKSIFCFQLSLVVPTISVWLLAISPSYGQTQSFLGGMTKVDSQSRADLAVSDQATVSVKGIEVYPTGTGPRGVVSFMRYTFALPIKKDERGADKVCLRPGFSPGEKDPSFGVSLHVSF